MERFPKTFSDTNAKVYYWYRVGHNLDNTVLGVPWYAGLQQQQGTNNNNDPVQALSSLGRWDGKGAWTGSLY